MNTKRIISLSIAMTLAVASVICLSLYLGRQTTPTASAAPLQGVSVTGGAVTSNASTSTGSGAFVDVPNMALTTPFIRTGDLLITFSAESVTSNAATTMYLRCLVDGTPVSPTDIIFTNDTRRECHAMTFYAPNVGLGSHNISIQWRQSGGGTVTVDERTLSYVNVN